MAVKQRISLGLISSGVSDGGSGGHFEWTFEAHGH